VKDDLENVPCNNCRSSDSRLLFVKNNFNIVQCKNCGLTYTNPRIKRNLAQSIYGYTYFKSKDSVVSGYDDYLKERPTIEATFKKRISFILDHAPSLIKTPEPRVLDVGCATGFLLSLFRELGWQSEGVEFSEYASSYAVNELKLNVRQGTLNNLEFPTDYYDLVTSWDVIEHSYNPIEDIKIMHKIIRKGGYIAIITPNRESLHARIVGARWIEYEKPEEHLYFFGKGILVRILKEIGFDPAAVTTSGKYVSVGFALNRLRSYCSLFNKASKLLWKNASNRYVYVNPLDKMFILARKM
jgi:2-polyprenyl-3-methyl-5-hydroxy-6-metoxy-1,4-benzoquinol methylase